MTSRFPEYRRWLIAAALVAIANQPAYAEAGPLAATRDTVTPYIGRWRDELAVMLARIATTVDSGFAAPERELVLRELRAIRPQQMPGSHGPYPARSYLFRVRFRGHESDVGLHMYWPGPRAVAFHVRSPDTLLLEAIDSTFHAARVALLSAPARVRLHLEDHYVWNGEAPAMIVALGVDEAKHCPGFGIETRGESRGDTVVIHVDGAAPKDSCPWGYWPPQMSHWRTVVPGRYHVAIDSRGDTNLFRVDVTDTSLALSTIRSTFAVADERIRWRVPSGSVVLSCSRFFPGFGAVCDELQRWAARQTGLQRISFDTAGVSPLRDSAVAYRYDDRALASIRSCIGTINPTFRQRQSVELRIRPRSGPWLVDRVAIPEVATRVASDLSCGLPRSIVDYGKTYTSYPLNCPAPTMNARRFVADVLQRTAGMRQWLRDNDVPLLTAETLDPLSGRREVARCRQIDSTSIRHPVAVFRAGRYFIATNIDGLDTLTLDGPVRGYLVWVLDSAGSVVQVPGFTTRAAPSVLRDDVLAAPKRPGAAPQDVHVTSTRSGVVLLQWGKPGMWPSFYELQGATGTNMPTQEMTRSTSRTHQVSTLASQTL
jgi:hypothetical protein